MHRFYASPESFTGPSVMLEQDETRHLRDVLRLKTGDEVLVFDGVENEYRCSVRSVEKKSSELAILERVTPASPESPLDLTIAAAVLKSDKTDLVIQKAVELGAASFIPLTTIRTDVKVNNAVGRVERWRRIAMEATKQCGRARLMNVAAPIGFAELMTSLTGMGSVLFSERGGKRFSELEASQKLTAIFGPEGGWDDAELDLARSSGCQIITLGGRVLRAETAAISIAAILQHRFGDLN